MDRRGFTLIEMLAVIFIIMATMVIGEAVGSRYGAWSGIGAALSAASLSIIAVIHFYRWMWWRDELALQSARDMYRKIYRVIAIPTDPTIIVMPEGAEIRVGDYGWEAGPTRDDGLIYLQGLTLDWTVVWHAGLHQNEIKEVANKRISQYDSWHPYWADPPSLPPCPFPVVERETLTVGRPHHSHYYFVEPAVYRPRQAPLKGKYGETV